MPAETQVTSREESLEHTLISVEYMIRTGMSTANILNYLMEVFRRHGMTEIPDPKMNSTHMVEQVGKRRGRPRKINETPAA